MRAKVIYLTFLTVLQVSLALAALNHTIKVKLCSLNLRNYIAAVKAFTVVLLCFSCCVKDRGEEKRLMVNAKESWYIDLLHFVEKLSSSGL